MRLVMNLDSYRRILDIPHSPPARLSAIDIQPEKIEQTLVFLHAFGGQARDWRPYMLRFASRFRAIALDLRGHGKSHTGAYVTTSERDYGDWSRARYNCDAAAPMDATTMHYFDIAEANRSAPKELRKPLPLTIELYVRDFKTATNKMEVDRPFILIGHSLGGAIALSYASQYPDNIEKLILFNTPTRFHLKPSLQLLFNLPEWQSCLVLSLFMPGSLPSILQNVYENSLRNWDADAYLRNLEIPILSIRTRDRFLQMEELSPEIAEPSKNGAQVLTEIANFVTR